MFRDLGFGSSCVKISADVLRSIQRSENRKDMKRIGAKSVRARKESDAASGFEVVVVDILNVVELTRRCNTSDSFDPCQQE